MDHPLPPDGLSPALELRGVARLYGRTAALKRVSLTLEAGQTLLLLGPNGSGKTTLLKIVAGAITPTFGAGSIFGRDMATHRRELRAEIGLLAAESYLYDDLTARENLRFIATMAGRRVAEGELTQALARVDLARHAAERVRTFSSGMRQRMSLARLLLFRPRLMLLDEPYNSLDEAGSELVDAAVREAVGEGRAAVLATHDAERGLALADVVATLDAGAITFCGPVRDYRASLARRGVAPRGYPVA